MDTWLLFFAALVLSITILYPAIRLLAEALWSWQWDALFTASGPRAIVNTLIISVGTVIGAGVLGTGLALLLASYSFPGRNALAAAAYMPLMLPPLVGALGFMYLIGRNGIAPRLAENYLGAEGFFLNGPAAILLIHVYSFFVFFYAMVAAAMTNMDRSLMEAARTLGAGRWRVFTCVTLPLLRPTLVGAALLTFMSSGASFSAPFLFGDDYPVLSTLIYSRRWGGPDERPAALTLTVVLAVVALLGLIIFRSKRYPSTGAAKGVAAPLRSATGRRLAAFLAWMAVAILVAPHAIILILSFVDHRAWGAEIVPPEWTWGNYLHLFQNEETLRPILNSLWMSLLATVAVLIVALPAAYLIGRRRRGGRLLNVLIMIPWALPGTVVAINLIVSFNDPWLPLYSTVWLLPLAYFVRTIPLFARMAVAAIEPFDAGLIEAGQTLGASRAQCFWRIVLPLIAPAVAAGAALVFATALGEFVASILLFMHNNMPIAVKINELRRGSAGLGAAVAYSVLLMALVGGTFLLSRRFASRPL
jgi:iron(III) transport system permease protein